jgi:DNA repair exonuclease SbcCD ATPase subunit
MSSLLRSISLTNFRSIRGTISIPLDASIVLIHGQNGAGKTSLLSGIELALTGGVPSLQRLDEDYFSHLVHKDATSASITVSTHWNHPRRSGITLKFFSRSSQSSTLLVKSQITYP